MFNKRLAACYKSGFAQALIGLVRQKGHELIMKTVILDANTLGDDITLSAIKDVCDLEVRQKTAQHDIANKAYGFECIITNKCKLYSDTLEKLPDLKLICVTATGYDNVDIDYCKAHSIAVCNVKGYSTDSVALVTVSSALSLITHLTVFDKYVKSCEYTKSGVQNRLTPVFHETKGKVWGVIGYGAIGKEVARIASALGFDILYYKKTHDGAENCVDLQTLLKNSDVVSLHVPANSETIKMIDKNALNLMKPTAILVNAARGAVTDEEAVTEAILNGKISGFATDVYSVEPIPEGHPFEKLYRHDNVLFTPHMAWGAYQARQRLIDEIALNIKSFENGENRNRVV